MTGKKKIIGLFICLAVCLQMQAVNLESIYTQRPDDPEAFYFIPENYPITADGKTDVSDILQEAINQLKREKNFGILFIPEGKYKISKTIYIPTAIRLIGYGKKRPEIILAKTLPAFSRKFPVIKEKPVICSGLPIVWCNREGRCVMPDRALSTVLCQTSTCV
ncbi:MAG: glycoside hydrolase family 55 protein [Tannerellaceae bacterium]|nr:glycoside hydrolase family 55 protein [Tannerellaceae bacterium]